jgi:hypothetical protein
VSQTPKNIQHARKNKFYQLIDFGGMGGFFKNNFLSIEHCIASLLQIPGYLFCTQN